MEYDASDRDWLTYCIPVLKPGEECILPTLSRKP